jgi:hypothetical protein
VLISLPPPATPTRSLSLIALITKLAIRLSRPSLFWCFWLPFFFFGFLVDIHSFIHQTTTCTYHIFTPSFLVSTQSLDLPINQSTHAHLRFHLICIISVASASQVLHPHFVFYKSYLVASQFEQKRNLNDNQDGLEDKPLVLLQLFRYNGWDSVQQCSQSGRKYNVTNLHWRLILTRFRCI